MTDELMTIDDIAALYKTTRSKAQRYIVKRPGFPDIAPGSTWRDPRWLAVEVRAYLRRKPAPIPHKTPEPA
jgi:hypothetical protein